MFKKLLISSLVLSVTTGVAFAGTDYKHERSYKGEAPCPTYQYMTGPYLGVSVGPRVNITGTPTAYEGFEGTVSAGWGMLFNSSWYLAGEIFGGDSADLENFRDSVNNYSVKSTWSYGIDVLPGYMITDHVLGYLRAGVVRTHFVRNGGTNATAWQVGVGGQTEVMPNWDVRAEYIYSQYNSLVGIGKPLAHQVNVGIVYKFI